MVYFCIFPDLDQSLFVIMADEMQLSLEAIHRFKTLAADPAKREMLVHVSLMHVQWNPSCEATPFASEKWPFKRGGLLSGVEINTFMFRFTLSSGLSRGSGLSSGRPLKRGSTVTDSKHFAQCTLTDFLSHTKNLSENRFAWAYFCSDEKSDLSFRQFAIKQNWSVCSDFSPIKNQSDVIQQKGLACHCHTQ